MARKRRSFSAAYKAKVALAAAKGDKTLSELASQFGVYPNQISAWKKQLADRLPELFGVGKGVRIEWHLNFCNSYATSRLYS